MTERQQFSIILPEEMNRQLSKLATIKSREKGHRVSKADIIRQVLEVYLEGQKNDFLNAQ